MKEKSEKESNITSHILILLFLLLLEKPYYYVDVVYGNIKKIYMRAQPNCCALTSPHGFYQQPISVPMVITHNTFKSEIKFSILVAHRFFPTFASFFHVFFSLCRFAHIGITHTMDRIELKANQFIRFRIQLRLPIEFASNCNRKIDPNIKVAHNNWKMWNNRIASKHWTRSIRCTLCVFVYLSTTNNLCNWQRRCVYSEEGRERERGSEREKERERERQRKSISIWELCPTE